VSYESYNINTTCVIWVIQHQHSVEHSSILSHWSRHWSHFSSSRRSFHTILPQITPSCVRIVYFQSFLFWVYSVKIYLIWCFKHRLSILSLIAIFLSNCKTFRNLAISVLRGIFIMTVVLPQQSPSSFYRSFFSKCKAYNGEYLSIIFLSFFQLSFYLSQFIVINPPPRNVAQTFLPQFRNIHNSYKWGYFDYFIHMITSWKMKLFLNSYESMYSFSPFHFKNSTESFSLVLLQVKLACYSYHEVRFQLPFVLKLILE
jgi:hypothetical protein